MARRAEFRSRTAPFSPVSFTLSVPSPVSRPLLVPFGAYDEWSLRDRYNEAIRIMNTLGASMIVCESYRAVSKRSRPPALRWVKGGEVTFQRVENSGFDFQAHRHRQRAEGPKPAAVARRAGLRGRRGRAFSRTRPRRSRSTSAAATASPLSLALGVRLKKLGFDLGGGHERTGVASLHITAQFPTPPKKGWL